MRRQICDIRWIEVYGLNEAPISFTAFVQAESWAYAYTGSYSQPMFERSRDTSYPSLDPRVDLMCLLKNKP